MSYPHAEHPLELRPLQDQQSSAATVPLLKDMEESSSSPPQSQLLQGPHSRRFPSSLLNYIPTGQRGRRLSYVLLGVIIMLGWIGLILAFARVESKSEKVNLEGDGRVYRGRNYSSEDEIWMLQGALRKLNSEDRTLTVQWSASQYFANNDTHMPLILSPDYYPGGVNMYRDVQAVIDKHLTYYDPRNTAGYIYYQLDNATAYPIGNVGLRTWDSFDTDIDLTDVDGASVWRQPMRGYPFDQWKGDIVIASNNVENSIIDFNDPYHYALSFDGISLEDSLLNWRISAKSNCTCRSDDSVENCDLRIRFKIRRPTLVKFTVIAVVIVNWLSTLAIFFLTGETLLLRRMRVVNDTDMLGVLFASLFALPGVRSLLPDAPPFGCTIDLVGILPNVIIISLCAFIWACMKLNANFNGENDDKAKKKASKDDA
ncbi:hypothetical protein K525DRAFT_271901 [Schizophyllum commune Loenen D]|nr:hypothetical protein K525DRAFT_271901 [Schizophyllum commune Loenen D]